MQGVVQNGERQTKGRYWAFAAIAVVSIHLQLALLLSDEGWVTSFGIGSACLLCLFYCLRCSWIDVAMRWRWALLAVAFLLWAGAFAAIAYLEAVLHADTSSVQFDQFFYMLRGVPFLLLLAPSGIEDSKAIKLADGLQAALFGLLVVVLLYPSFVQGADPAIVISDHTALAYHDVQNFGLAILSLLALVRSRPAHHYRFYCALAALLTSYAIDAWVVNHLLIDVTPPPPPGSAANVLGDVPMMIFLGVAASDVLRPRQTPELGWRLVIAMILPGAFCVASVATSIAIGARNQSLAVMGAVAAVALFGVRSAIAHARLIETQRELASMQDELRALANVDALTGLPNRRCFDDRLQSEWRRLTRSYGLMAIAVIDVDHFKLYNDAKGHLAGDACLRRIAEVMQSCVRRDGDFLARYGGEEFAVLTPVIDQQDAMRFAEKIRRAVEMAKMEHAEAELGVVTISIGVAVERAANETDPVTVVKRADQALYRAKIDGRNRVEGERRRF